MAYYSEPEKDEEDTSQGMNVQEGQAPSSQPVQLTTPSSISSSAGSTSKSAAPKSASSGSGPSFQNYAKANQGKAQENLNLVGQPHPNQLLKFALEKHAPSLLS